MRAAASSFRAQDSQAGGKVLGWRTLGILKDPSAEAIGMGIYLLMYHLPPAPRQRSRPKG